MDNFQRKTPPPQRRERNEVSCEPSSGILNVPLIVEVVVVPVPPRVLEVEVTHVQVVLVAVSCEAPSGPLPLE